MDDNLADYADPLLYDEENADFEPDGPMFLALARRFGNPILELGCGTGRLTLPLARAGLDITGIDVVNGMLERARANARDVSVAYIEADVRTLDLGREFRLIFESGATFQHLLTQNDQTAMLRRVREHLAPGGRFVVSVTLPTPELTKSELEEQPWYAYEAADGRRVRVSGTQEYDPTTKIKTETAYRRWQSAVAGEVVQIAPLRLRYWSCDELEAVLIANGLHVTERYGSPRLTALTSESNQAIYVCRTAPGIETVVLDAIYPDPVLVRDSAGGRRRNAVVVGSRGSSRDADDQCADDRVHREVRRSSVVPERSSVAW